MSKTPKMFESFEERKIVTSGENTGRRLRLNINRRFDLPEVKADTIMIAMEKDFIAMTVRERCSLGGRVNQIVSAHSVTLGHLGIEPSEGLDVPKHLVNRRARIKYTYVDNTMQRNLRFLDDLLDSSR